MKCGVPNILAGFLLRSLEAFLVHTIYNNKNKRKIPQQQYTARTDSVAS